MTDDVQDGMNLLTGEIEAFRGIHYKIGLAGPKLFFWLLGQ
jgi:hypothetical protein